MEFDLLYMDFDALGKTPFAGDLIRDLKLKILLDAMAEGDKAIYEACAQVLTNPLVQAQSIRLRNEVVRDAVENGEAFESLYTAVRDTLERTRKYAEYVKPKYDKVITNENKIVHQTEIAQIFMEGLKSLKALLIRYRPRFQAEGLLRLCDSVNDTLTDEYIQRIQARIEELSFLRRGSGVSISGHIGEGLKQTEVVLNRFLRPEKKQRLTFSSRSAAIPLNSITLIQNAQEITEKALAPLYAILAGFNRAVQRFFEKLDFQLKFFAGSARLHRKLAALKVPVCYPEFGCNGQHHEASMLVDAGLALKDQNVPVGNDVCFSQKRLVLITGPNQGGKTTFLRSVGLAQLMAQCGLFVTAKHYACPVFTGIFTHFPNGEDDTMRMGLLEVELKKLSALTDALKPGALLLMNESFQTTTPGDAKQLAQMIVPALKESGIFVLFVTHLYG
jgi:DNA mismatch repair ATPase MutS